MVGVHLPIKSDVNFMIHVMFICVKLEIVCQKYFSKDVHYLILDCEQILNQYHPFVLVLSESKSR